MSGQTATVPLLRNRHFRLIWLADSASSLGNGMSQLAYPLLMLAVTGSPLAAGALAAVRALPYLIFGLPAGALVDRCNRRRTIIISDLLRAVNMASIPLALTIDALTSTQLYVTGFVGGTAYVFANAARASVLPHVVPTDQLTRAISTQETTEGAVGIAAAPLGGALLQLARPIPFLIDALSFLLSAVCFSLIRDDFRTQRPAPAKPTRMRQEILVGLRWLWRNRQLRLIAVTAGGLQLAISGILLVAIVIAQDSGASPGLIRVTFSAIGIGAVIGAALAPAVTKRLGIGGTILTVLWIHAALWVLLAFATHLALVGVAIALFTLTMPWFGIAAYSYQLRVTPDELRGRIGTSFNLLLWAATPIAGGAAGLLLETIDTRTTAISLGAWVLLLAATATIAGQIRAIDHADNPTPQEGPRSDEPE